LDIMREAKYKDAKKDLEIGEIKMIQQEKLF
jgi:hypothetical protein